jgi:hypothetical protein
MIKNTVDYVNYIHFQIINNITKIYIIIHNNTYILNYKLTNR